MEKIILRNSKTVYSEDNVNDLWQCPNDHIAFSFTMTKNCILKVKLLTATKYELLLHVSRFWE